MKRTLALLLLAGTCAGCVTLTPREEAQVNRLGLPGLEFMPEGKRVYPEGNLFAHSVGYTDTDGKGLAGVEREVVPLVLQRHAAGAR